MPRYLCPADGALSTYRTTSGAATPSGAVLRRSRRDVRALISGCPALAGPFPSDDVMRGVPSWTPKTQ